MTNTYKKFWTSNSCACQYSTNAVYLYILGDTPWVVVNFLNRILDELWKVETHSLLMQSIACHFSWWLHMLSSYVLYLTLLATWPRESCHVAHSTFFLYNYLSLEFSSPSSSLLIYICTMLKLNIIFRVIHTSPWIMKLSPLVVFTTLIIFSSVHCYINTRWYPTCCCRIS
jgi:hypothetical protein